ncbi:MAG: DUF6549 family protein [Candidatus Paceibacterota bacterium]
MDRVKNYGLIVLAVFLLILAYQVKRLNDKYDKERSARIRLQDNYDKSKAKLQIIKNENGELSARLQSEQLTKKEIIKYYSDIVNDISDMKIQLRKVAGVNTFGTETTNNINTFFKDSVIINTVQIQTLNYSDQWIDLKIVKEGLKTNITAISRDSLIQVFHWQRSGQFWPTKFMTKKEYFQDLKSMNPNSRIIYAKSIDIIKK